MIATKSSKLIRYSKTRAEVLVTGTFNVLHAGHCELLEFASSFGPVTVGINGDEYQVGKYGEFAVAAVHRAAVLNACRYVDEVVIFTEADPSRLILQLKPKFFIRGPDYLGVKLPELDALESVGARVIIQPVDKISSGTELSKGLPDWLLGIKGY